ncbi:MAG: SUMF1/EgtB/PvdO family nonheme iron enzyme [Pseudomonadota bacterium]
MRDFHSLGGRRELVRRKVFICYRRTNNAAARLLYDRARRRFGDDVFMDIFGISDSADFRKNMRDEIRASAAIIVVVGEGWSELKDDDHDQRRIWREDDPVRFEIREALSQGLHVFPVVLGRGAMPKRADLPEDIRAFADRSARHLPNDDLYDTAVDKLLDNIAQKLPSKSARFQLVIASGAAIAAAATTIFIYGTQSKPNDPVPPTILSALAPPQQISAPNGDLSLTASRPSSSFQDDAPPRGRRAESQNMVSSIAHRTASPSQEVFWSPGAQPFKRTSGREFFTDCAVCPELKALPAGEFDMGVRFGAEDEKPRKRRVVAQPFAIGRYEVTEAQWRACEAAGACARRASGDTDRPVAGISWRDAADYALWLTKETGFFYRLPTEVEWEYAADFVGASREGAHYDARDEGARDVGASSESADELYDMIGNVWEWTSNCYASYQTDLVAFPAAPASSCRRVLRGGGWETSASLSTRFNRWARAADQPITYAGLRIARDLVLEEVFNPTEE